MVTAFAGPAAAQQFLYHVSWRWGFGCFCIMLPVIAAPMYLMFRWNLKKAKMAGILVNKTSDLTVLQRIQWGLVEFDGEFLDLRETVYYFLRCKSL